MADSESIETHCDDAAAEAMGADRLRDATRAMQRIRRFEERAARDYASGHIHGFCHLYIGQEAVAVGTLAALESRDHVITAYRDHGHALLRGCTMRSVMAELHGKVTGTSRGRGGSMHLFSPEQNFHGGHGIVGAHIPLATGFAFASAYEERGEVSVCFFGDGALNQGAFYESLNLASLWNLPAIYIVENNAYAMGTPLSRASAISDLATKADGFAMTGLSFDGMDIALTWKIVTDAAKQARDDLRPTLLEAICYRYRGHSMSDPAKYRTRAEVDKKKAGDPILRARNTLISKGWATEDELDAWDDAAKEEAADASEFALDSPQPHIDDVGRYVYVDPLGWTPETGTTPHDRS